MEEMSTRGRKFVTTDDSAILAKPPFDSMVVESSWIDRCLSDPPAPTRAIDYEAFRRTDNPVNRLAPSTEDPR